MKQFGKGFTLNQQQSTYQQLVKLMEKESEKRDERKNSKRSRAHRLDEFITVSEQALLTPEAVNKSCHQKIMAICEMVALHNQGFVSEENLLRLITDIVGE